MRRQESAAAMGSSKPTDVREGSLDEHGPESEETSAGSLDTKVLNECSRVAPPGESDVGSSGSGSSVEGDSHDDETDDGENLDDGEPELSLCGRDSSAPFQRM